MIVTDLDNTLLRRDKSVSGYTARIFRQLRERGILAAFATARDFRYVTEHISPLFGIIPDVIISNIGALALYNGCVLYKRLIPEKAANLILPRFARVGSISTESAYFLCRDYAKDHWSLSKRDTVITDFTGELTEKALFISGDAGNYPDYLTADIPDVRIVKYSDISLVTVVHREATKLNALTAVRNFFKIEDDEFAVFGDDFSDIELLSNCVNGVAVSNAIDECKNSAKFICGDCDNDGVAKWVEENVLT
jgi:HAD superfamily hydrolase (TIGR01484 family)